MDEKLPRALAVPWYQHHLWHLHARGLVPRHRPRARFNRGGPHPDGGRYPPVHNAADLSAHDLPDLTGADLRWAVGEGATIGELGAVRTLASHAYLPNLTISVGMGAPCSIWNEAHLRKLHASGVDLRSGMFYGTDLQGAVLCFADLRGSTFVETDLCGADLTMAKIAGAVWRRVLVDDATVYPCGATGAGLVEIVTLAAGRLAGVGAVRRLWRARLPDAETIAGVLWGPKVRPARVDSLRIVLGSAGRMSWPDAWGEDPAPVVVVLGSDVGEGPHG